MAAATAPALAPAFATAPSSTPVSAAARLMGGTVVVQLLDDADPAVLEAQARRMLLRAGAWADRLTRFDARSELCRLNASPLSRVPIGPTLTAVLDWARTAEGLTDGLVDAALLDARLAAEWGVRTAGALPASRRWSLARGERGATVRRDPGVRFDLDGVAKGWIADRALATSTARSALVDGDGDIAVRVAPGDGWVIGIADPREPGARLGVLELAADDLGRPRGFGVATSGTSVHRWAHPAGIAHHLIDPWTGRPAATDVVQATVLAASARVAEAFAKVAVISGSGRAFDALARPDVLGLLLLTERGEVRASEGMLRWLA